MLLLMKMEDQKYCLKDNKQIFLDLVKIIKKYRDLAIYCFAIYISRRIISK